MEASTSASGAGDLQDQVRRHRATVIGALMVAFVLIGAGPRNQRALFATLPFGNPEALAAIVVPPPSNILFPGRGSGGALGTFGIPAPLPPAGGIPPAERAFGGPPALAEPGAPVAPPVGPEFASAAALPDLLPGFAPGLPVIGGGVPGGSVGNPAPGGGGGTPGGGSGGGGPGPGGDGPPATPVPEPSSWLLMIAGVMVVGAMLRRLPGRGIRPVPSDH